MESKTYTPEEVLNLQSAAYQKGYNEGYALRKSEASVGPHWVKASKRLPLSWLLKCVRFIHTKQPLIDPETWLNENEKAIEVVEWLDESTPAGSEEDAVAFAEWILKNDIEATFNDKGKAWVDFRLPRGKNKFTTAELYELFKNPRRKKEGGV